MAYSRVKEVEGVFKKSARERTSLTKPRSSEEIYVTPVRKTGGMSFQRWVVDGTRESAPLPHWFTAYLAKFVVELTSAMAMAGVVTVVLYLVTANWNSGFLADVGAAVGLSPSVATPLIVFVIVTALILDRLMWCKLTDHARDQ